MKTALISHKFKQSILSLLGRYKFFKGLFVSQHGKDDTAQLSCRRHLSLARSLALFQLFVKDRNLVGISAAGGYGIDQSLP